MNLLHGSIAKLDLALVWGVQPLQQAQQRGLARAAGTHDRGHLALGDDDGDVLDHILVVVPEAHVLKRDVVLRLGKGQLPRQNLRLEGHELRNLGGGALGILDIVEAEHELEHVVIDGRAHGKHGHQPRHVQPSVLHQDAAGDEDDGAYDALNAVGEGLAGSVNEPVLHLGLVQLLGVLVAQLEVGVLVGGGFDQGDAGQPLGHKAGQFGHLLPHRLLGGEFEPARDDHRGPDVGQYQQQGQGDAAVHSPDLLQHQGQGVYRVEEREQIAHGIGDQHGVLRHAADEGERVLLVVEPHGHSNHLRPQPGLELPLQ